MRSGLMTGEEIKEGQKTSHDGFADKPRYLGISMSEVSNLDRHFLGC